MSETRQSPISGRRFDLANLRGIADLLFHQVPACRQEGGEPRVSISIHSEDGTLYQADSLDILSDDSDALLRSPLAVEVQLHDYNIGRHVLVRITQFGSETDVIRVRGKDSLWIRGVYATLLKRVEAAESTNSWYSRHPIMSRHLGMLCMGFGVSLALRVIADGLGAVFGGLDVPPDLSSRGWFQALVVGATAPSTWLGRYFMGAWPWIYLSRWLDEAYPNVEIAVGPAYRRRAEQRKKTVSVVVGFVIVPMLMSVAYDVLKGVLS